MRLSGKSSSSLIKFNGYHWEVFTVFDPACANNIHQSTISVSQPWWRPCQPTWPIWPIRMPENATQWRRLSNREKTTLKNNASCWSLRRGLFGQTSSNQSLQRSRSTITAVALAFEEMRTPFASGRENLLKKQFAGKCVPAKRNRKTNDAFQKHLDHRVHRTIQRKCCSQTMHAFRSQYPRAFRDRLPLVLRPSPALAWRCTHRFHDFAHS